jgi:hypothetical protein
VYIMEKNQKGAQSTGGVYSSISFLDIAKEDK